MEQRSSSPNQNSEDSDTNKTLTNEISTKVNYISNLEDNINDQYLYLLIVEDNKEHNLIYLGDSSYQIGRRHNADIILRDLSVSRNHATIIKEYNKEDNLFFTK